MTSLRSVGAAVILIPAGLAALTVIPHPSHPVQTGPVAPHTTITTATPPRRSPTPTPTPTPTPHRSTPPPLPRVWPSSTAHPAATPCLLYTSPSPRD